MKPFFPESFGSWEEARMFIWTMAFELRPELIRW